MAKKYQYESRTFYKTSEILSELSKLGYVIIVKDRKIIASGIFTGNKTTKYQSEFEVVDNGTLRMCTELITANKELVDFTPNIKVILKNIKDTHA